MILVIQTVKDECEIFLLDSKKKIIGKSLWKSKKDEAKQLLPKIKKLLKKHSSSFKKISLICVARGIGGFSATRIGVTTANILAFAIDSDIVSFVIPKNENPPTLKLVKEALIPHAYSEKPMSDKMVLPEYYAPPSISTKKK